MAANTRKDGVSPELDELSAELMGQAFDLLAEGESVSALLVVGDAAGNLASYEFEDDDPDACLAAAHERVRTLVRTGGDTEAHIAAPQRFALCYEGAVADEAGIYHDALLLEFGERGWRSYSAYSLISGKGAGEAFSWSEPAPAGELDPLL